MSNFYQLDETGAIKALMNIPGWANEFANSYLGNGTTAYEASAIAFRSIEIRSQAVPEAKLRLYDANGEEIESHAALDVLAENNLDWSLAQALRDTESDLCVFGSGYWEKIRNGKGLVKELFRFNPGLTTPVLDPTGIREFQYSPANGGVVRKLPRPDVIYFRGAYNPKSDLIGVAPLRYALIAALGESNADKYLNAFFQNNAMPATLIVSDNPMPPKQEMDRQVELWNSIFKGVSNQHKVGFVYNGGKPVKLGTDVKDLALDIVRAEMRRTISTSLGVPEILITPTNAADLTPVEMALKIFYTQTVLPRWKYLAEVLNNQLLTEFPDLVLSRAYFEFDTSDITALNEAETETANRLSVLVEKKIIRPDVAAIELGYSKEDVPEEKPVEAPVMTGTVTDMSMMTGTVQPETVSAESELVKWQRKSLNALKENRLANVPFDSAVIPATEKARIETALKNCKTADEVKAVFSYQAEVKPEDLLTAVIDLARAVRDNGNMGRD